MAEITMPRLSDTMSEGTVGKWLKQPGDKVENGEIIAEIETDKATMELQAFESGTLQKILVPEGQTVPIGQPIALIGDGAAEAEAPAAEAEAPAPEAVPMSRMRRAIARAMTESKPGTPHIYVTVEIDMAEAMKLRKQINDSGAADIKISVNDLVVKAAAKALLKFPALNSSYA